MGNEISISSCFDYNIRIEDQIRQIAQIGFSHISLGMNTEHSGIFDNKRLIALKKVLEDNKIKVDTIHYPALLDDDNWYEIMEKTMECAVYLNSKVIVVHCTEFVFNDSEYDKKLKELTKRIIILERLCYKYDVKLALENLCIGKPTEIVEELLKTSNPEFIGFCYDSSHDQIDGPRDMDLIKRFGRRLLTVHISDRIKEFTDHVIPGEGFINFKELANIMKELNISFPILMEVEKTFSEYKETELFLNKAYDEAVN